MAKTHGPPIVSKNFAKGVMHWGKMYPDLQLYQQPTAEPPGHFLADPSLVLPGVQNCASVLGRQEIPFCFVRAEFFTSQTGQDWQAEVELLV
jgi:hypothetical protein